MNHYFIRCPCLVLGMGGAAGNELKDKAHSFFHVCSQTLKMQRAGRDGPSCGLPLTPDAGRGDGDQRVALIRPTPGA